MSSRPPTSEYSRAIIEQCLYPNWHPPVKCEGVELDIAMEHMRLNESNSQWLRRQANGLLREMKKKQ